MPWRPPSAGPRDLEPRLAPFRERGGRLHRSDGELVGEVYLQPVVYWTSRGLLWWRRWTDPDEIVHGFLFYADGRFDDFYAFGDGLEEDLRLWPSGTFRLHGEDLQVFWLDDKASRALRQREDLDVAVN